MKLKIFFMIALISFAGLFAQQTDSKKFQKPGEDGFIEVDKAPELTSPLQPVYPKLAKLSGIQGTVYLKLLVNEKGNVEKAKVLQGVKDMLDESALAAAKSAKFTPAIAKEKPVKVWVVLPVRFKLDVDVKEPKIVSPGNQTQTMDIREPGINDFVQADKLPEMIEADKPVYPEEAKKNGITGKVFVKILIDTIGAVKKAVVIKSDHELLNQPAIDAAVKSKFTPAYNAGKPIAVWIVLPYRFTLDGKEPQKYYEEYVDFAEAKKNYDYMTFLIENLEARKKLGSGAGVDAVYERIVSDISFGDESAIYKMTVDKKTIFGIIARDGKKIYQFKGDSIDEVHGFVDGLSNKPSESFYVELIYPENKVYPREAIEKDIEGNVLVRVIFDEKTGKLEKAELYKGGYEILNKAAVKYLKENFSKIYERIKKAENDYPKDKNPIPESKKFKSGSLYRLVFDLGNDNNDYITISLNSEEPLYPKEAIEKELRGAVLVKVFFENEKLEKVETYVSNNPILDKAAEEIVRRNFLKIYEGIIKGKRMKFLELEEKDPESRVSSISYPDGFTLATGQIIRVNFILLNQK